MLKTFKDVAFKAFTISSLDISRLTLFEIFIKMFLDEVTSITQKGIQAAYTSVEKTKTFIKVNF